MRLPKRTLIILIIVAVAVGIAIYYAIDPTASVIMPKCLFKTLTGYDCPGCGSQRAIHSILHGDFVKAFHFNALLVLSIPYLILLTIAEIAPKRFKRLHRVITSTPAILTILAIIILWWIFRNMFNV